MMNLRSSMKRWNGVRVLFAMAALAHPAVVWGQSAAALVGFWTVNVGAGVTQDYAFTKDGKFESKIYGSAIYQVSYGTYTVQGDRLTLSAPKTTPETFRWKVVPEFGRASLKLTDTFGATTTRYTDRWDQRYGAGPLVPYAKAKLASFWIVNHGGMHAEWAFTEDGKFQFKRINRSNVVTVRGTYIVKDNILILTAPDRPMQGFGWRIEVENGNHTLILVDTYGAFEIFYESKPE